MLAYTVLSSSAYDLDLAPTDEGKSVTVTLTDRCQSCGLTDLDFSPSAFIVLADFSIGRISGMTWVWV